MLSKGLTQAAHFMVRTPPCSLNIVYSVLKVDADFLAMIKEAEDDESKGAEGGPLDVDPADDK